MLYTTPIGKPVDHPISPRMDGALRVRSSAVIPRYSDVISSKVARSDSLCYWTPLCLNGDALRCS